MKTAFYFPNIAVGGIVGTLLKILYEWPERIAENLSYNIVKIAVFGCKTIRDKELESISLEIINSR